GVAIDSADVDVDEIQDVNVERIVEDEELRNAVEKNESVVEEEEPLTDGASSKFIPNTVRPIEQLFFVAPVRGDVSEGFRPDKKHWGVDLLAPKDTPIQAAMRGIVIFSDWTQETGHTLAIQHDNNIVTFYKHNSTLLKNVGDLVKSGEAIAIIGNTGTLSSGPHLHFEVWYNGNPIDPVDYISFN
ncbi:MAG: M23 family metallopeptidase, partial [Saprospiraceae bacterium]